MRHAIILLPVIWRLGMNPWVRFVFERRKKGTYLTCPIFSASRSHWGYSSRKSPVMLQGPCYIKFQIGKEVVKHSNYQHQIGVTAACIKRMTEATKGVGQKYIKGATQDCFLFDSWLSSKKWEEYVMEVGAEFIGVVRKNTKGFCKETLWLYHYQVRGICWR